jgi:hypothetical protein
MIHPILLLDENKTQIAYCVLIRTPFSTQGSTLTHGTQINLAPMRIAGSQ